MTTDPDDEPTDPPPDGPVADGEITLEEWIAAGQGCCGTDPDDG